MRFLVFSCHIALVGLASAACTSPKRTVTPSTNATSAQIAALKTQGYLVSGHIRTTGLDGTALYVYRSVCSGSADGHCQAVDVFQNREVTARWHKQYIDIRLIRAVRGGFAVTSAAYRPNDPLCCPSLRPVTQTYIWRGKRITHT